MSPVTLFTIPEAAEQLGISPSRVRQFCLEGRIGQKIGWQWLISPEEIRLFAQIQRPTGRPPKNSETGVAKAS